MPDWMLDYAASIGKDSYAKYQLLAKEYHREINDLHTRILPNQNRNLEMGKPEPRPDLWSTNISKDNKVIDEKDYVYRIDEKYKSKALDIASEYGYVRPHDDIANHYQKFTDMQERSPFSKLIKHEDKTLSHEDIKAKEAHRKYFTKHPEAKENFQAVKAELKQFENGEFDPKNSTEKKDLTSKEQQTQNSVEKHDIDSMSEKFMSQLSSNKNEGRTITKEDTSKDSR